MVAGPITKRRKTNNEKELEKEIKISETLPVSNIEKCNQCKQYTDQLLFYNGHPNNSCEEIISLSNEKLMLFTGSEEAIHEADEVPSFKITHFSIYDEKGHLCPFDTGLIEKNVHLLMSGYVKPIYEENSAPEDGFPTHDIGPINSWWTAGFDGGEKVLVGVCSTYAEYYFMEPSPEYDSFWKSIHQKVLVWKLTIEFLLDECHKNPPYEDLLQHLESSGRFEQPEEVLIKNAQFVCDQIDNYYDEPPVDEPPLITLSCIRSLIQLSGITIKGKGKIRKVAHKDIKKKTKQFTRATTTKLVHTLFETMFPDQLDNKAADGKGHKRRRCGVCEACQQPDCGECSHCKNMLKFGGTGTSKQACKNRKCPYMLDPESDEEDDEEDTKKASVKHKYSKRIIHSDVKWVDDFEEHNKIKYYNSAQVGDLLIKRGDFVMLNSERPNEPLYIAEVAYMFESFAGQKTFHANVLCRGSDTILGETSDPRELFIVDECEDCPLGAIVRRAEVEFRKPPENWEQLGGTIELPPQLEDNGCSFFISKRFEKELSRFTDYNKEIKNESLLYNCCESCKSCSAKKKFDTPILENDKILWRNQIYKEGTAVFLNPDVYDFKKSNFDKFQEKEIEDINEEVYPEYFRKKDTVKGSNIDTPDPFHVAIIQSIVKDSKNNFKIKVNLLCRPDDTKSALFLAYKNDLNYLYWTDIVISIEFLNVTGICYLAHGDIIDDIDDWTKSGPYRFYFIESYDFKTHTFGDVPSHATKIGLCGKGKGKGKGKGRSSAKFENFDLPPIWDKTEPLRCMDVFAGCGGLSEGLHEAGIAETKWAIEIETAPAQAFRLNYPDCKVFHDDCNDILKQVMNGEGGKRGLPQKGDVELLCGGPPCQGFSGMNRFNAGQYSLFKSSLMVSYLSYCDYYRPKYFILENVRNFVSFKRSMVLKLAVRCLLAMGYQVTFGVLQAGHYGVPQTRRRFIIMAAAPGYVLPTYPEPQHVFNKRGCQLSFVVDDIRYFNGTTWIGSAPYRTVCVRDAMSDLPDISSGWNRLEMPYDGDAISHYQKLMRKENPTNLVKDHICKEMSAIVEARISQIPTYPGADWRDLPNIAVKLKDGTMANTLRYPYRKKNQSKTEPNRGVCACATGEVCDPTDRQNNTLIPWCLPHTADRHNHWAGLYGRLEWDGFFGTTITNPEPMGKQGRVLHPEQNRVVSVRECARSQGFPDRFKFYGNILDKHRQVGNAVPPPLGCALGKQIRKAYAETLKVKGVNTVVDC